MKGIQIEIEEEVNAELDAWKAQGLTAKFWWRDDDAVTDSPQLRRLLDLADELRIVVALGVVPQRADCHLVRLVSKANCCIWQHGWSHEFHASGEFGDGRSIQSMKHDALTGQRALDRLLGPSGWQPVFVPPNHSISVTFKALIPHLGYIGLSAGAPSTAPLEGVAEVNAEIDVMNWPARTILPPDKLYRMILEALRLRRRGELSPDCPVGILTHHLEFEDAEWQFIYGLFESLMTHDAVEVLRADRLFELHQSPLAYRQNTDSSPITARKAWADVGVILTSCGRPDLLRRTIDSFLKYNSYPIREFNVVEDGETVSPLADEKPYCEYNIKWLCTGKCVGQIAAIDFAYGLVQWPYIFHCEDDWEFTAAGFIEKSLAILEHNADVLQVWIRALNDTNGHPVTNTIHFAENLAFRLLEPEHHSKGWGTWHGFSFNPGLRRRRDYLLIGSFGALDPGQKNKSFEIERKASKFYFKHGFLAAILADNQGNGYVRHIGWNRRVGEVGLHLCSTLRFHVRRIFKSAV